MSNKILKYTVFAGIFVIPFVPFVVAPSLFFPFITGKAFIFRLIVQVIFACWLVLAIRDEKYRPKFSWILVGLVSFLVAMGIATIFAENPFKAFWSNYERMEGYITLIHLFLYFLVLGSMLKTQNLWNGLLATSVGASLIMVIYSFFQLAGRIPINQGGVRVDGTLGNAAYLAIYLVFHIFFALLLYFRTKNFGLKIILIAVALMNLVILYHSATRGAIIGLVGGLFVGFLFLILKSAKGDKIRKIGVWGLATIIVLLGLFFAFRNTAFISESPVLSRFSTLSVSEIRTQGRYFVWPMAIQGFIERPILGWGQEGFNFVFNKNYDPRMYAHEPWFDRAHNTYLDWLIAGGLLGFFTYISIFGALLYYIFRSKENVLTKEDKAVLLGLTSAYMFNNFFVFDQNISYILFFTILAYVHSHASEANYSWWQKLSIKCRGFFNNEKSHPVLESMVLILFLASFYFVTYLPWKDNANLISVLRFGAMGQVGSLEDYKRPFQEYRMGFAESLEHLSNAVIVLSQDPNVPDEFKTQTFGVLDRAFNKHIEKVPNDARYRLIYGIFLSRFGLNDRALEQLNIAQELSPRKQSIYFERINNLILENRGEEALQLAKEAYELEPSFEEAKMVYALTASMAGDRVLSDSLISKMDEERLVSDDRYLSLLMIQNNFDKAVSVAKRRIELQPSNLQAWTNLAGVYLQTGNTRETIRVLEEAMGLFPEFKEQGEFFISEIRAGRNP